MLVGAGATADDPNASPFTRPVPLFLFVQLALEDGGISFS